MSLTGLLVLSADVQVVPVADLAEGVRDRLAADDGGRTLTRPHVRASSAVVDDALADLLSEFVTPSTVVDAVLRYSARRSLDPERVLDNSYPALRGCVDSGYLVAPDAPQARAHQDLYQPGDRVRGGVVVARLQALEDTEVYRVVGDDGRLAALKVLRPGSPAAAQLSFGREAEVLRSLGGRLAPGLLDEWTDGERRCLLMEWCEGVPVTTAAGSIRASPGSDAGLLDLARRLTRSYAALHAHGVVHGDVHPGNAVVAPDGTVRLLDFGLAELLGDPRAGHPARGAAPPYLAPDHAAALLAGRRPGPADTASDQFSLGAVLYEMFTGRSHVDFSIDDRASLEQIVAAPPLAFTRRGRTPWPDVERALARALAKDADRRFPTVGGLAEALHAAALPAPPLVHSGGVASLLDAVLSAAGPGGSWYEHGIPTAPLCSVAYGSAGLAAALHHVALLRDDGGTMRLADEWVLRATAGASHPDAFHDAGLDITDAVIGPVTPFHRVSGVHAVQALISQSLADVGSRQGAVDAFVRHSHAPGDGFDLTLGRTGSFLIAALLLEAMRGEEHVDLGALTSLGAETLAGLWRWLDSLAPVAEARELPLLGIAHGWSGMLLATLRWCRAAHVDLPPAIGARLDQVAGLARAEGDALWWPWSTSAQSSMRGWCNGSAGVVHLWIEAHTALADERWLRLAEGAARHATVIDHRLPQLCCGLAGQAYAALAMYRHTGEAEWLRKGRDLAEAAATVASLARDDCTPGSLHKGELGVAALAADLERPEEATMPFFGPAG